MEQITILGSSNAVAKLGQENTHLFIDTPDRKIMVDCGDNPMAKLTAIGTSINEITDLVLTHFHADHLGSLPLLIMDMWLEKRQMPLTIHGLEYTLDRAKRLLELFNWQNWQNMFQVEFNVIAESGSQGFITGKDVTVSALSVLHLVPTIGLRFEFKNGRVVTYSCDTEPCDNLFRLAQNADVLMQEAAGESKGHTSAKQAGEIATKCHVKKLALIHYERRHGEETLVSEACKRFGGEVVLAQDLMRV